MYKSTSPAFSAKAPLLGGVIGLLSVALMTSCSTPAPYIYVAPQKAPVEYKETKPKPQTTATVAKTTPKKEDPRARSFSLEERVRLEPVQAGGGGEELSTTIIKGNSN
jgi:hypothetical protein